MTSGGKHEEEGIIVEFIALGGSVKVTAIDPVSLREVSIVGPVHAPRRELARLAARKLRYVLSRGQQES